nr:cytochrome P450 CYP749A22-like [Malus domestica]
MEPELCKEILNNKDRAYPKKEFGNFEKKVLGDGMATTLNVAKWMKLRKIANHALHGESLKAHHDANEKERISVDDMIDECKTFYFAGQETTNIELAWIVFLLAVHTDWQEEARREVLELVGKQNPSPEGIAKLKTMSMIINESLRLYPPAVSMERKVDREVRLGNFIIPANVELVIPILAIHHEPEFWGQDAQLFKPERFARGVAKATNNNIATYIPFGMGPRTCVGMDFAIIEVKIALSKILERYRFTLSPAYVHSHDPSQDMVDSDLHTEVDGFAGDQTPFLHEYDHQRVSKVISSRPAVSLRRKAGREVKLGKLIIAANIDLISSSHV